MKKIENTEEPSPCVWEPSPCVFGLVGHPLGHTLSPSLHKNLMNDCGIDGVYNVYDILPEEFDDKIKILLEKLDGFNITIPYKEKIIPYLDNVEKVAMGVGAVNAVYGNCGFNTDSYGFNMCKIPIKDKRVLLLGAGGAARVMLHEIILAGAKEIVVCSRNETTAAKLISKISDFIFSTKSSNRVDSDDKVCEVDHIFKEDDTEIAKKKSEYDNVEKECDSVNPNKEANVDNLNTFTWPKIVVADFTDLKPEYDVIINATPVGMWPGFDTMPISKEVVIGAEYVFDSIYNPISTKLILTARSFGIKAQNGLAMLYFQGFRAQQVWNPNVDFAGVSHSLMINKLKRDLLKLFPLKFVITGFMGCGKSTVGKAFAQIIDAKFYDLDDCIIESKQKSIPEIFDQDGEASFRQEESRCLASLLAISETLVIATGGGALIQKENVHLVKQNKGFIFLINICLETIVKRVSDGNDRPLITGDVEKKASKLYLERLSVYNEISDCTIDGEGTIDEVAKRIADLIDF